MTTVSLRFDDNMKKELDEMCDEMGMNITTFFMIYAKKALRERSIPFEITAPIDPFYSNTNRAQIEKAEKQVKDGKIITKSLNEPEAMASASYLFCGRCMERILVLADTGQENIKKKSILFLKKSGVLLFMVHVNQNH